MTENDTGNAATMREAIGIIRDMLINGGHDAQCRAKVVTICNTVLSTPPRNCDSYDIEDGVTACMQAIDAAWHEIDTIRATIGWMLSQAEGEDKC